jgi:hypothetical protein
MAQLPGTFTATGNMTTPRFNQTATLLTNGEVLMAGGAVSDSDDIKVNSDLYDPATGTFTATRMTVGNILLPDGRFLIFTGSRTAETYDPLTGAFEATGDMVAALYSTRASTLLQDGRVFVAGYPTSQIYDPVTGTFTATRPYAAPLPAILQTSTVLADGRVLLTGAVNICYQPQCREPGTGWTQLYDPRTDAFSVAGRMNWWNNVYTATLLLNGKVLFVGGDNYNGIPSSAEIFDPSDGTFTAIESPSAGLQYSAVTLLSDGTVLITGGFGPGANGQLVSEIYSSETGGFTAAGNMITARWGHTATLLLDGTVLIAGGADCGGDACVCVIANAEIYQPVVSVPAPQLFFAPGNGLSQGAILHAGSARVVTASDPAIAGEVLEIYGRGLNDGGVIPPQVAIGGRLAEILYFGSAPGYAGLNQINVRVPGGVTPGSAVPVRMTYLNRPSNAVSIGIQ